MSADTLKGVGITNLDTTAPGPSYNTDGFPGGTGRLKVTSDYVTPTAAGLADTGSTYRVVRLPCNAKVKKITLTADAALDSSTGLVLDVGAYYSDATTDGTAVANQAASISVNCFAAAKTFQSTFQEVDCTGSFGVAKRSKELWDALGLSSNPGGYIDVVVAVHTAATSAASHALGVRVEWV